MVALNNAPHYIGRIKALSNNILKQEDNNDDL
ncbi:hypothetical protein NIES4101_64130 [Calothrix sp. NIES-4101]|nr:hypothetical protein NIES4101_64130 [Calothrix sp. NIES-4101]